MDRNQAKEFYPIMQAFAEGKIIETRRKPSAVKGTDVPNEWTEMKEIEFWKNTEYRIKPEPKYRPFKNAEECWNEMLKHQPFGWIKCYEGYLNITYVGDEQVYLADPDGGAILLDSKNSYQDNTFVDGTPFGIKVEEQRMILYQIWCKRTYVSGGFCEGEDEPTQLIFTTLDKARSKIPKDHYSKENGSREYYIKKIEIE